MVSVEVMAKFLFLTHLNVIVEKVGLDCSEVGNYLIEITDQ